MVKPYISPSKYLFTSNVGQRSYYTFKEIHTNLERSRERKLWLWNTTQLELKITTICVCTYPFVPTYIDICKNLWVLIFNCLSRFNLKMKGYLYIPCHVCGDFFHYLEKREGMGIFNFWKKERRERMDSGFFRGTT